MGEALGDHGLKPIVPGEAQRSVDSLEAGVVLREWTYRLADGLGGGEAVVGDRDSLGSQSG